MNPVAPRMAEGFPGERLVILPAEVVRHARTLPLCRDVRVTHIGCFDRVRGHYVARTHGLPEYVLIVCLAGAGRVRLGGATWRMRHGHGIVLPPRVAHRYEADPADPWTIFWFHFEGRRAPDCVQALGLSRSNPRFWVQDTEILVEAFEDCYRHVLGGHTDADLIGLTTFFLRLVGLCRTQQRSHSLRRRRSEERIVQSIRFMRLNLHRSVGLGEIAREVGLSVSHYSAIFRRQTRCGPMEFFNRLRMHEACERLTTTSLGVAEIAFSIGFEDPLYFSRCFRKHLGVSPSDFRIHSDRQPAPDDAARKLKAPARSGGG